MPIHPFRLTQLSGARALALAAATVALATLTASSAHAAFPGTDGRIAYASYPRTSASFEEIYVVKPNGHGLTRLTNSGGSRVSNVAPDWNATGTRIAYQRTTNTSSSIRIIRPNGNAVSAVRDGVAAGEVDARASESWRRSILQPAHFESDAANRFGECD